MLGGSSQMRSEFGAEGKASVGQNCLAADIHEVSFLFKANLLLGCVLFGKRWLTAINIANF
jgi:hypothetical protein